LFARSRPKGHKRNPDSSAAPAFAKHTDNNSPSRTHAMCRIAFNASYIVEYSSMKSGGVFQKRHKAPRLVRRLNSHR
jgi:hypothetical protein